MDIETNDRQRYFIERCIGDSNRFGARVNARESGREGKNGAKENERRNRSAQTRAQREWARNGDDDQVHSTLRSERRIGNAGRCAIRPRAGAESARRDPGRAAARRGEGAGDRRGSRVPPSAHARGRMVAPVSGVSARRHSTSSLRWSSCQPPGCGGVSSRGSRTHGSCRAAGSCTTPASQRTPRARPPLEWRARMRSMRREGGASRGGI